MKECIYVDSLLLEGMALRTAIFVKELNNSWVLQSEQPKTNNIDEYEQLDKEEVLEKYPELRALFELELNKTMSFRKGVNSGKWYDFL